MAGLRFDETLPEHFVLGSGKLSERFGAAPVMPGGHGWGAFVPAEEPQFNYGVETMNCVVFATLKAYGTLARKLGFLDSGWPENCSERYNGIMSNTTASGNSPHNVAENLRTQAGVIPDRALPWTPDLNVFSKYYSPKPLPTSIIALGQALLKHFDPGHEWVFNGGNPNRPKLLIQALERGTVCASVYAWKRDPATGLYVKDASDVDQHWVQIVDFKEGEWWEVSDQYAPYRKRLAWDYPFYCAKLYALSLKSPMTNSDWQIVLSVMVMNLKQLLQIALAKVVPPSPPPVPVTPPPAPAPAPQPPAAPTMQDKIYEAVKASLGKRMALDHSVDPELGCAQAWSAVAKLAGVEGIPPKGYSSTIALAAFLASSKRFVRIDTPEPGATIISVTRGNTRGHVGFFGRFGVHYKNDWGICSNNSDTGLFREHWNFDRWLAYYRDELGLQTVIYRAL